MVLCHVPAINPAGAQTQWEQDLNAVGAEIGPHSEPAVAEQPGQEFLTQQGLL